ncbi:fluoride efflux transporter CrcB [Halobacteriales archaeon QH_6_68_27]|nr:MAG: fluoride efflux transporter CrcB [Halobacteriales archaeon QH_6_68_27]
MTVDIAPAHLVGAGGALGAVLRHAVSQRVEAGEFPAGTLVVNVVGSFVLGFVVALGAESGVALFVGTGACGSFTTFSSFSVETVRLWETGARRRAFVNAAANLAGAVAAVGLAWVLVRTLGTVT